VTTFTWRAAVRGAAVSVAAGLIAVALLAAGARWWLPATVHGPVAEGAWTARSRALFTPRGFHRPEYDVTRERHFSWTRERSTLAFPSLSRSIAYLVTLTVRGSRPAELGRTPVRVFVDGRLTIVHDVASTDDRIQFEVPRADRPGATVDIETVAVYRPGPPDPRELGIVIEDVAVAPVNGPFRPSMAAMAACVAAVAAVALGLWLLGLRGWWLAAPASAVVAGFVWLLVKDVAFAGAYPDRLLRIGLAVGALAGILGAVRRMWPSWGGVSDWATGAGLTLAAAAVKLGVFWHPLAIVGDGLFQVHRAQLVHGGEYFFTSVTPRPFFEFPYPVALYVNALPFWEAFPSELDLVRLLRLVTLAVDALVGMGLYLAIRRQWPALRPVALFAVVLWPFAGAPFEAISNANLTNVYGQGVFGLALAAVAWMGAAPRLSWAAALTAAALFTVAFLSHFGTVTVGMAMLATIATVLVAGGRGHVRRSGVALVLLALAAVAMAWWLYYSHPRFTDVYRNTYASVTSGERDDTSKIVAAPSVKLQRWWLGIGDDYGRPGVALIVCALAGLFVCVRRRPWDAVTLVFGGVVIAWLVLSAIGILTPFTLRANLAAAPAFLVFSSVALGTLADRSRLGTTAAGLVAVLIAWDGWRIALRCLDL